ncbi:MAG: ABC transporter ATP-binding protein [Anaerolineae bacterium]
MALVIQTENLTRLFGDYTAVDHLNLEISQGEVFGFLGPNGAGKTTTVRLLNGVLGISTGRAVVLGHDVATQSSDIRRRVGVLTENPSVYDGLTARENLQFIGEVFGVPRVGLAERVDTVLQEFDLAPRADDRVGTFSKGMRQRLSIARVILHEPELIFLDEPTSGLDPEAARMVTDLIQSLSHQSGRTVFLCTHNLDEAQRLCDRVGVIDNGRLQVVGTPADLSRQLWQGSWVEIDLRSAPPANLQHSLDGLAIIKEWSHDSGKLNIRVEDESTIPDLVSALSSAGARIYGVQTESHSLSEIYFRIQQEVKHNGGAK